MMLQRSSGEFSSGVPERTIRRPALRFLQLLALPEPGFLMCWASSRIRKLKRCFLSVSAFRRAEA